MEHLFFILSLIILLYFGYRNDFKRNRKGFFLTIFGITTWIIGYFLLMIGAYKVICFFEFFVNDYTSAKVYHVSIGILMVLTGVLAIGGSDIIKKKIEKAESK